MSYSSVYINMTDVENIMEEFTQGLLYRKKPQAFSSHNNPLNQPHVLAESCKILERLILKGLIVVCSRLSKRFLVIYSYLWK